MVIALQISAWRRFFCINLCRRALRNRAGRMMKKSAQLPHVAGLHGVLGLSRACAMITTSLLLSACATADAGDFPSLNRRPVERQVSVAPSTPASSPVPAPVSATLVEAIRTLGADADRGEQAFRAALAANGADVAAGRGAAAGGENWAVAQRAYSRIESSRAPTTMALAELDRLLLTQPNSADLTAQQARVAALVDAQMAELERIGAGL
jgi:hypothetical protein